MYTVGKIASCQIAFSPLGSTEFLQEINQVLEIIKNSGLEYEIGIISTVIRGEKSQVLELIKHVYETMDDVCNFTMDVKISNICGCGQ